MLERTANIKIIKAHPVEDSVINSAIQRNGKLIEASLVADPSLSRFREIVAGIKQVAPRSDDFIYFVCRAIHAMEAVNLDPVTGQIVGDGFVNDKGRWESPSGKTPFPYCLTPETDIQLADGSLKKICDIQEGDEVITHLGNIKKVTRVFSRYINENIKEISAGSSPAPIHVTKEHPFAVLKPPLYKEGDSFSLHRMFDYQKFYRNEGHSEEIVFVKAGELIPNAVLVAPKIKIVNNSDKNRYRSCDNYIFHTISEVKEIPYEGLVYNFEVEDDNSYIANGLAVHNCNQNGDAFPEAELLKVVEAATDDRPEKLAYHTFIGRGLFVNHASDDAEKIRGIILDATWDPKTKGVDLLVACDKIAYPELARQIQAGYSNDVSMGTSVSHGVCSECGNIARTDSEYCEHIKIAKGSYFNGRPVYEANFGLNFIEISVVATGADPKAKIRQVLAHLNKVVEARKDNLTKLDSNKEVKLKEAQQAVDTIRKALQVIATSEDVDKIDLSSLGIDQFDITQMVNTNSDDTQPLKAELDKVRVQLSELQRQIKNIQGVTMVTDRKAYFNEEGEPDSGLNDTEQNQPEFKQNYQTVRDQQDKQMVGKGMESGDTGMHPGYGESDKAIKERLMRAEDIADRKRKREALLKSLAYFNTEGEPDSGLNTTEQNNAEFKQNYQTVRDQQDKQMVGKGMESGDTGMHPGYGESDEALKQRLLRANKLKARLRKANTPAGHRWIVLAGEEPILEATAGDLYGETLDEPNEDNPDLTNFQWVTSADYGRNLIAAIRELGLDAVKREIAAASTCSKKTMKMDKMSDQTKNKKDDKKKDDKKKDDRKKDDKKKVKAQVDILPESTPPTESAREMPAPEGFEEEAGKKEEEEESGDVDINIDVGEGEVSEAAGEGLPPEVASALQDVAEQIAAAGEQLASIIGAEGGLDEEAMAEGEEVGEEVVETGEEIAQLGEAVEEAGKVEEQTEEGSKEEEQAITAKKELGKLILAATSDARKVLAKAKKFITKHAKKDSLAARREARRAVAQKLYNLTSEDMTSEAHPKGNTTAVPGHEVMNGHGIHDASESVATKNPTGQLTASQKNRRLAVAKFIKAMEKTNKKPDADKDGIPDWTDKKGKESDKEDKKGKDAKAAADPEAKKYYNELFNSDPEAKKFATDLAKDYNSKKTSADLNETKKRMHRAYKVALRQAQLGQINNTAEAVENQVDTLMKMDNTGFDAFATAVENTSKVVPQAVASNGSTLRTAGMKVPEQGKVEDPRSVATNQRSAQINDLTERLNKLGWSEMGRR